MKIKKKKTLTFKTAGRPEGSAEKGFKYPKNQHLRARVTEGFNETLELLAEDEKSESIVLHKALQHYAYSKKQTKELMECISKII